MNTLHCLSRQPELSSQHSMRPSKHQAGVLCELRLLQTRLKANCSNVGRHASFVESMSVGDSKLSQMLAFQRWVGLALVLHQALQIMLHKLHDHEHIIQLSADHYLHGFHAKLTLPNYTYIYTYSKFFDKNCLGAQMVPTTRVCCTYIYTHIYTHARMHIADTDAHTNIATYTYRLASFAVFCCPCQRIRHIPC